MENGKDLVGINEWNYFIEIMPMGTVNKKQIRHITDLLLQNISSAFNNNEIQYKYQLIEDRLYGYVLRLQIFIDGCDIVLPISIFNISTIYSYTYFPNLGKYEKCKFISTDGLMFNEWNYIIKMPDDW